MGSAALLMHVISCVLAVVMSGLSCVHQDLPPDNKIDALLSYQIRLKKEQLANPTPSGLEHIKALGMRVDNLNMQSVYMRLNKLLSTEQADELKALGITLYLDSWIPPVSSSSTGSIRADVPVNKLDMLTAKDYVIGLETAEWSAKHLGSK